MSTPLVRRPTRAFAVIVTLAALIVALHGLARLGLRGPTGLSRSEVDAWLQDPLTAAATLARWTALALSYYLAVVVLAVMLTGDRLAATPLRYIVPSGLASTIGLALGISAIAIPLASYMHQADDTGTVGAPEIQALQLTELEEPLTLRTLEDTKGSDPILTRDTEGSDPILTRDTEGSDPIVELDVGDETWTVEPGDSFWAIAEEHLRDEWNRADLSETEIATYWRILIDANTDRLVQPGNPDLLLPGQVLLLPATSPSGR